MTVEELRVMAWRPQEGDVLVVKNREIEIDAEQAADIRRIIQRQLNLPEDVRIMVVGRDWEPFVIREQP